MFANRHSLILWRASWMLLLAIAGMFIGWRMQHGRVFETDLLKLLPEISEDRALLRARDAMRDQALTQIIFLVGHRDFEHAKQASKQLAEQLSAATENGISLFKFVQWHVPQPDLHALAQVYTPYPLQLLSHRDQLALRAGNEAYQDLLLQHFFSPVSLTLEQDHYGLLARFLQEKNNNTGHFHWRENVLASEHENRHWILVRVQTPDAIFDNTWQQAARSHIDRALQTITQSVQDSEIVWTGTVKFAQQAREQTSREMNIISSIATVGVLLLLWLVLRRFSASALMLLVIASAMLGATALSLLFYKQLHLITYVFGATLIGIAGDYALHVQVRHASDASNWNVTAAMRQLRIPLTTALLTTLLAYLAIAMTPFEGFRQIAVFCVFGLLCSYLSVVLFLPAFLQKPEPHSARGLVWFEQLFERLQKRPSRRVRLLLFFIIVTVTIGGFLQLNSDDDIHLLQKPDAQLVQEQQRIMAISGVNSASQFFVVRGADSETVLQREEALVQALNDLQQTQKIGEFQAISRWLPSQKTQQDNHNRLSQQFKSVAFTQFIDESGAPPPVLSDYKTLDWNTFLSSSLATSWQKNFFSHDNEWFSLITLSDVRDREALSALQHLPGVQFVDERAAISTMFKDFRTQATLAVLIAYAIVFLLLGWQRGWQQALRRLLPTVVASIVTIALLGWCGMAINLFHGIALMLVLGIGVDYALFLADGEGHEPASLMAIVLSAITAMLAFGLLAFSHLPAIAGFGLTVLLGVALALLFAPTVFWWTSAK